MWRALSKRAQVSLCRSTTVNRSVQAVQRSAFHSSTVAYESTNLSETVRDFLEPEDFYNELKANKIEFFAGVPDSLLKDFCAYVTDTAPESNHVIASNEGNAVAIAAGYHLATDQFPCVYLQNSGFGNCVNPLLSLTDPKIYGIPMLLLIGWRGEPGKRDEPQHLVQGQVMSSLLTDMNIQFSVLPDYIEGAREALDTATHYMQNRKAPYAFLVKRQTFTPYKLQTILDKPFEMNREDAINVILKQSKTHDCFVSTTGFASREVFEYRANHAESHKKDFLCVGNMGHASGVALGIAKMKPSRSVYCLDGDGALFMHMGAVTTIGNTNVKNLKHIVINNGVHDSVGGQPTPGFNVDVPAMMKNCGYKWAETCSTKDDLLNKLEDLRKADGPACLEIQVNGGARSNLGRPTTKPVDNKLDFMGFLQE